MFQKQFVVEKRKLKHTEHGRGSVERLERAQKAGKNKKKALCHGLRRLMGLAQLWREKVREEDRELW